LQQEDLTRATPVTTEGSARARPILQPGRLEQHLGPTA